MSRSIHTTRKSVTELEERRFESEDQRKSAVKRAKTELERKRRIKRQVRKERRSAPIGAVRSGTEAIPIRLERPKPFVFHAVSEEDIREILRRLPAEAVEGIDEIRLLLGEEFTENTRRELDVIGMKDLANHSQGQSKREPQIGELPAWPPRLPTETWLMIRSSIGVKRILSGQNYSSVYLERRASSFEE